ncbi:hypothetical protein BCR33DRAFT_784297 [Rhizoclosmatium globosum]|uniref:Uncharacterized protein n=1 Tax=Rhizoclosmatium globosum TaxID=329046 RepID=A0A1Y2CEN7_9FUNG|nr:hypothetical protein BCR33DRAFT_784297 [Rhizoclosmatium globosum]|eukprot:ORY45521.1 hypothetical protein BCR33DRAFT_784297 [Rhizoclosmatium globosum]
MSHRQYGFALVPAWLSFLLILVVLPAVHFHALQSELPSWQIATIGILIFASIPLMFPCEDWTSDLMVKGLFAENFIYYTLAIAFFPKSMTSKWSFKEYMEFMITAENESVRRYDAKVLGEDNAVKSTRLGEFCLTVGYSWSLEPSKQSILMEAAALS